MNTGKGARRMRRFADTLIVVTAGQTPGPDGEPIDSWDPDDVTEVTYPAEFQPVSTTENVVGQQRTESTHRGFLPADAVVTSRNRLRYAGVLTDQWGVYRIEGDPERWSTRGKPHHIEVFGFRVQGG